MQQSHLLLNRFMNQLNQWKRQKEVKKEEQNSPTNQNLKKIIEQNDEKIRQSEEQIKLLEVQNDCLKEQLKRAIENEKVAKKEAKYNRIWAFISTFIAFASLIATIVIAIVKYNTRFSRNKLNVDSSEIKALLNVLNNNGHVLLFITKEDIKNSKNDENSFYFVGECILKSYENAKMQNEASVVKFIFNLKNSVDLTLYKYLENIQYLILFLLFKILITNISAGKKSILSNSFIDTNLAASCSNKVNSLFSNLHKKLCIIKLNFSYSYWMVPINSSMIIEAFNSSLISLFKASSLVSFSSIFPPGNSYVSLNFSYPL